MLLAVTVGDSVVEAVVQAVGVDSPYSRARHEWRSVPFLPFVAGLPSFVRGRGCGGRGGIRMPYVPDGHPVGQRLPTESTNLRCSMARGASTPTGSFRQSSRL